MKKPSRLIPRSEKCSGPYIDYSPQIASYVFSDDIFDTPKIVICHVCFKNTILQLTKLNIAQSSIVIRIVDSENTGQCSFVVLGESSVYHVDEWFYRVLGATLCAVKCLNDIFAIFGATLYPHLHLSKFFHDRPKNLVNSCIVRHFHVSLDHIKLRAYQDDWNCFVGLFNQR